MGKDSRSEEHDASASALNSNSISVINQLIERSSLENFTIRFPQIVVHAHFYYCFREGEGFTIGEHAHQHWEITRVSSGRAEYSFPGKESCVCPDKEHYLIIPPGVTHGWKNLAEKLLLNSWQIRIEADDEQGEETLRQLRRLALSSGFLVEATSQQVDAENLLWNMCEVKYPPQIFGSMLCGFVRIVIGDLLAAMNPWPDGTLESHSDPDGTLKNLAERLKTFLDENLSHPVTLKEMESHFHYTGRHLNRIFQEVYHVPIGQYLRMERVDLAKRWLRSTDRSIKDIALSLGYSNSSQFCRYFLKQTGDTPTRFRQSEQNPFLLSDPPIQ